MINLSCDTPLSLPVFLEYWFGDLAPDQEQPIEEHLLACSHCSRRLQEVVVLGSEISSSFRRGEMNVVISSPFMNNMKAQGLRFREYCVPAGGTVECTITTDDDAVIGRLQAPLEDVKRLDIFLMDAQGKAQVKLTDIPFDRAAGEVLFCPPAAELKKLPAHTDRIRLVAIDELGERKLGDYTFNHTPS
jgi:hypothetical protein